MGTPILAGTNFHVENDISSRMAAGTISIGNYQTIQAISLTILSMDQYDTRSRLVNIPNKLSLLPGEPIILSVPTGFPANCEIIVEPNLAQTTDFFTPHITQVRNSLFTIKSRNSRNDQVIQLKTLSSSHHPNDNQG